MDLEECSNDPDWTPTYDNDTNNHNNNNTNTNNNNNKPLTAVTNITPKLSDRQAYMLNFIKHSITSDLSKCKISSF